MSIKIVGGCSEEGVIIGNTFDKYSSRNFIVRFIMNGFSKVLSQFIAQTKADSIHEIGCGEGYWVINWNLEGKKARGSDFSEQIIDIAKKNANNNNLSSDLFKVKSIYDLESFDKADLIVCLEVLEHLKYPEEALNSLKKIVSKNLIITVPREPLWCFLNLCRGKYMADRGNTPGHIQHWSKKTIINIVSKYFNIISVKTPIPFTMLLCEKKEN